MNLKVLRTVEYPETDCIFGELYIDGEYECKTLERYSKAIPIGIYPVSLYFSPRHQFQVPLLTVPGREYIEIHPANYPNQLLGCIAVVTVHNQDSISTSRFAFNSVMQQIQQASDDVSCEVACSQPYCTKTPYVAPAS